MFDYNVEKLPHQTYIPSGPGPLPKIPTARVSGGNGRASGGSEVQTGSAGTSRRRPSPMRLHPCHQSAGLRQASGHFASAIERHATMSSPIRPHRGLAGTGRSLGADGRDQNRRGFSTVFDGGEKGINSVDLLEHFFVLCLSDILIGTTPNPFFGSRHLVNGNTSHTHPKCPLQHQETGRCSTLTARRCTRTSKPAWPTCTRFSILGRVRRPPPPDSPGSGPTHPLNQSQPSTYTPFPVHR